MRRISTLIQVLMISAGLAGTAGAQTIVDGSGEGVKAEHVAALMATLTAELKDPGSAQLRAVQNPSDKYTRYPQRTICGLVNAKNSYGGYTGFSPFAFDVFGESVTILTERDAGAVAGLKGSVFRSSGCRSALGL